MSEATRTREAFRSYIKEVFETFGIEKTRTARGYNRALKITITHIVRLRAMRNTKEKSSKTVFDYRLISLNTRYAKKSKNVIRNVASRAHADVLRLVTCFSPPSSIVHKGNIFCTK